MNDWPDWWTWELELTSHLLERMVDRQFNEIDVRLMLENAGSLVDNHIEERWVIITQHQGRKWEIVVQPLPEEEILLVITAYPVE